MKIDFEKQGGLIPTIIQDAKTGVVLMLGYMNEQAYKKTIASKLVTFWSRSRNELWTKGETSGNYLKLKEILLDCDKDAILIKANPTGSVCHTGKDTCWGEYNKKNNLNFILQLENVIQNRIESPDKDSYISQLFSKGINKIAQKVGEEAVEVIIEAKDDNDNLFLEESADLLFHQLILLQAKGFKIEDVINILLKRQK